jgi:divalent metal cation (Fe/Co/Zn/Cd) transporter
LIGCGRNPRACHDADTAAGFSEVAVARGALVRRGIALEIFTLLWMMVEAAVAVAAGVAAGSAAGKPESSTAGVAVSAAALLVMPSPGVLKRRTGNGLGSRMLMADAAESLFCAYLSATVLSACC